MRTKPKLLIVEDERELRTTLSEYLEDLYSIVEAENGVKALEVANSHHPDLILMDVMMPEMDGFAACKELRQQKENQRVPILFLTASNTPQDRIHAFNLGADDFISKPFEFEELIARLNNKYQRSKLALVSDNEDVVFAVGNLTMNVSTHEVKINQSVVVLSPVEFGILKLLMEKPGHAISRKDILKFVWEDARKKERLIDAHVTALRKKIVAFNGEFQTIYGLGYKLLAAA